MQSGCGCLEYDWSSIMVCTQLVPCRDVPFPWTSVCGPPWSSNDMLNCSLTNPVFRREILWDKCRVARKDAMVSQGAWIQLSTKARYIEDQTKCVGPRWYGTKRTLATYHIHVRKKTDGQTDGRTDGRTPHRCFSLSAMDMANVIRRVSLCQSLLQVRKLWLATAQKRRC